MNGKLKRSVLYTVFIAAIVIIDQLSKLLAVKHLMPIAPEHVPVIKGLLHLTYVENEGAAFGMLADQRWIFILVSTVTIIGLSVYLYIGKAENLLYEAGVIMVIAGGIGNMIDRLALGYVIDFFDFAFMRFAVFNVADSFVCIGAGVLILALIIDIIKEIKVQAK